MADLENAYALNGPEDCRRLYADWAASYDAAFAQDMDYRLPGHVAGAFLAHGGATLAPVLDVGAGTGLLGAALRDLGHDGAIDGVDLSDAMLARARDKALYRHLFQADITRPLRLGGPYAGILSSGTFTHGHVGPEALAPLEAVAAPGCLFALSINAGVYAARGFDAALAQRPDVALIDVPIYGPAAAAQDPAHAADRGLIAVWRHSG